MDIDVSQSAGKPIRCKAAVCRKAGEALSIEEIEVDPPKAWEVRIKILCTSLCHTDLSHWKLGSERASRRTIGVGELGGGVYHLRRVTSPVVAHRVITNEEVWHRSVVESVGENVDEVEVGDTVLPVFHPNCGACSHCKSSKSNRCSVFGGQHYHDMPRDGTSRFRGSDGKLIHQFISVSSFSEYTVVDIANVVKIDSACPVNRACLLSCGVSTGVGATWKVAKVEKGSTVAIFGLGAVGLAVAEGARLNGASKIIGVDLNPEKFELGKKFGVTDFINPSTCGEKLVGEVCRSKNAWTKPFKVIKEMTDEGEDYCFECIGVASVVEDAFNSTREGCGKTVILGVDMRGTPSSLNTIDLLMGKTVTGSFFGGLKPKIDIPLLAQKYLDKELNLDDFITRELSFQEINKAFELLIQGKSLRCIMWMVN